MVDHLSPTDDAGSDTFSRYRYQAKVTLFYWLSTLQVDGPIAVYAEHIEDTLVDLGGSQRLLQIKSRAKGQPRWTAREMCKPGGGIDSLARAFAVARDLDCTFELCLEGERSTGAETADLVEDPSQASPTLREIIAGYLSDPDGGDSETDLDEFLSRLRIVPDLPDQDSIDARCKNILIRFVPDLPGRDVERIYALLLERVEMAQEARHPGFGPEAEATELLAVEIAALSGSADSSNQAAKKRLTSSELKAMLPNLPVRALRLGSVEIQLQRNSTALERKMTGAGASPHVVTDAIRLRAMADVRRYELLSGPDFYAEHLDDLGNRVEVFARGVAARHSDKARPANYIWGDLMTQPGLEELDLLNLFDRDRQALIGLLCSWSDQCRFSWAIS